MARSQQTPTQAKTHRAVVPIVPVVPILSPTTPKRAHRDSSVSNASKPAVAVQAGDTDTARRPSVASIPPVTDISPIASDQTSKPASPTQAPPKSWADLVRSKVSHSGTNNANSISAKVNGLGPAKNETLADVLNWMSTDFGQSTSKIAFVEPRGLVNTGNMCYMNSVSLSSPL